MYRKYNPLSFWALSGIQWVIKFEFASDKINHIDEVASDTEPMELLYKDFDSNGSIDAILGYYNQGQKYPSASRDEVLGQVNFLKKKYLNFKSYSEVTMDSLFTSEQREGANSIFINRLKTSYFALAQSGKFTEKSLPVQMQFSLPRLWMSTETVISI